MMAASLLGALKDLFNGSTNLVAAAPGGWHVNEGAAVAAFPYVTAVQHDGTLSLQTSSSNIDDAKIRVRVWAGKLELARPVADLIETAFLTGTGLDWTGGWSTALKRVNRTENKSAGRAPDGTLLRSVDLVFLAQCHRSA
jgi:hypothetical protein